MSYGIGQFWRTKVSGKEWLDEYNQAMANPGPVEHLRSCRRWTIGTLVGSFLGFIAAAVLAGVAAPISAFIAVILLSVLGLLGAAVGCYQTKHTTSKVKDATHKRQWFMAERQKLGPTISPTKQYAAYSPRKVKRKGWSKWTAALLIPPTSGLSIPIYGVYSLSTSNKALNESKVVGRAVQTQQPLALSGSQAASVADGQKTGYQNVLSKFNLPGAKSKNGSPTLSSSSGSTRSTI